MSLYQWEKVRPIGPFQIWKRTVNPKYSEEPPHEEAYAVTLLADKGPRDFDLGWKVDERVLLRLLDAVAPLWTKQQPLDVCSFCGRHAPKGSFPLYGSQHACPDCYCILKRLLDLLNEKVEGELE